ncbi:MAG TPA: MFS transporter [Magnetospirillaceae bacterium]
MTDQDDGLYGAQRIWAIISVLLGLGMAILDGAIANVALPTIARDLNANPANSVWVVNAYQVATAVTLLPLAALGEILGFRKIWASGLALFTLASLACGLSSSFETLVAARVAQGIGASGMMAVMPALVRHIYPRSLLGRGLGINALVVAVSSVIGPTVAAAILAVASWQWLFAINVPLGIAALAVGTRSLPKVGGHGGRFDIVSAVLNAIAFGLLIAAVDTLGERGKLPWAAAEFVAAAVIGLVLVRRELAVKVPLVPVDLLRRPAFALAAATSVCSYAAQMLGQLSLPFYFQNDLGRTATETGLLLTPWPIATGAIALVAGRVSDRFSPGRLCMIGLGLLAVGLALIATMPQETNVFGIGFRIAICGFGFGLFQTPNNKAMMTAAPKERSGGAGGMVGTARLLGQTTGAALVALAFGVAPAHGTITALIIGALIALLGSIVSALRLTSFGTK